jgi:transposase-like protein
MQRLWSCGMTVEAYAQGEGHRQVRPEVRCPNCGSDGGLHRHGTYRRWITTLMGLVLRLLVARFLCCQCRRTVSYLPDFALSYRLVQAESLQAYLEGELERRDVQRWQSVLRSYERRMRVWAPKLIRTVGAVFGPAPPEPSGLWPWLKGACGDLRAATRQLVTVFRISLWNRYQCHQPHRRTNTRMDGD